MMKFLPSMETIKAAAKYIFIGAAVFAFGMVWNFPYERIRETLTGTLTRKTGYKINMDELSPALPIGFMAKNARVVGPPTGMGDPLDLQFSSLRVTLSPLAPLTYLFKKSVALSYTVEKDNTKFKGGVSLGKEDSSFDLETKNWKMNQAIPMGQINPMLTGSDLKVAGTFALSIELNGKTVPIQSADLSGASGKLKLTAINTTLEVPLVNQLRFDKIQMEGALDKGKLNIKSITLNGPDVTGTASGSMTLAPFFVRSQIDLDTKLTISSKMEQLKTMVTTFGSQYGLRLNEQGAMAFKVTGQLDQPNIRGY